MLFSQAQAVYRNTPALRKSVRLLFDIARLHALARKEPDYAAWQGEWKSLVREIQLRLPELVQEYEKALLLSAWVKRLHNRMAMEKEITLEGTEPVVHQVNGPLAAWSQRECAETFDEEAPPCAETVTIPLIRYGMKAYGQMAMWKDNLLIGIADATAAELYDRARILRDLELAATQYLRSLKDSSGHIM